MMIRGWKWRLSSVSGAGLMLCSLLAGAQIVQAQDSIDQPRQRFEFSAGTWISTGETRWAHDASSIAELGNPTSKLTYKDVGTNLIDLSGKFWFVPRIFGRLNGGFADIGGGRLTDDDYGSGQRLFSRTFSNIPDNNTWYINADLGARVKEFANHRGYLDLFGGYQYWHTEYRAVGIAQVACDPSAIPSVSPCAPAGTVSNEGQKVITNTTNWHSIRVGTATEYRLTRQLSVLGTIALLPLSILENKDIHHLRSDLQQNPSISMFGIGIGADADVGARFMFTKNVALNVGYRVWWNRMLDGNVTFRGVPGSNEFHLTEFQTLRHGLTAGLTILF
jgi:hypothetical protein